MFIARRAILALVACTSATNLCAQRSAPANGQIRVTLLGTAGGPPVRVGVAGISTLVEAGGDRFLFDAGRGAMQQLVEAGLPMAAVSKLFLTHLHSDHIIDIPDLLLSPWSSPSLRRVPLEVWGPEGTRDMMDYLQKAFAFDIHMRRDVDEHAPGSGIEVVAQDIHEGTVYAKNGVTIRAFLVDHGPVKPAFGYRVDYGGRSVCLSGDTRPSENLVSACRGVDVLIHEAINQDVVRKLVPDQQLYEAIVGHHTTPEQAADIFRRVAPRLAVFSHTPPEGDVVDRTRRAYSGRVEQGVDLMVIDVGDDVIVRRPSRSSTPR
jgi:ribonuclease Z